MTKQTLPSGVPHVVEWQFFLLDPSACLLTQLTQLRWLSNVRLDA
jgi:hypothetical protein